jgi:isopropylmalate/homocitrate/citramalate synthase
MQVLICDVGPRDGLQNEPEVVPPETRAELVDRLAAAGLRRIEAVSFVRADRVPQMAGAEDVIESVGREGIELSGLVLNERGWERFAAAGLDRVNVTFAATDTFNLRNGNATLPEAIERAGAILAAAGQTPATVTISCSFGCPFEGRVDPGVVAELAARFLERA